MPKELFRFYASQRAYNSYCPSISWCEQVCWQLNDDGTGFVEQDGMTAERFRWQWSTDGTPGTAERCIFILYFERRGAPWWGIDVNLTKAYVAYTKLIAAGAPGPYDISVAQL